MTRRKFIRRVLAVGSGVLVGLRRAAAKAAPRKFVRALRHGRYPGPFRAPHDILTQGRWSG